MVADPPTCVRQVSAPNYGLLYDTFHANIEEKDPVGVIAPNMAHINHVHFSGRCQSKFLGRPRRC